MSDYIKREDALSEMAKAECGVEYEECAYCSCSYICRIRDIPPADVVEVDKAQKEIDYWHDKAQSYEQTILKLSLNKADIVEVVRCKDCRHFRDRKLKLLDDIYECDLTGLVTKPDNYCNYGEGV